MSGWVTKNGASHGSANPRKIGSLRKQIRTDHHAAAKRKASYPDLHDHRRQIHLAKATGLHVRLPAYTGESPGKDAWDYRIVHSGNYGLPERLSDIRRAEPKTWPLKNLVNPSQGTIECWYRPAYPQRERGIPRNERKIGTNHSIVTMRWHEENSSAMTSTNAGFYWNELVQGPVVWSRKSGTVLFAPGKQIDWEPGQWFHLAMTWKDKVRLYVNGELAFETENKGMIPDDPATGTLLVGDNTPEGSIDELRILDVERPPVAPFGPYAKDAHTTLLEHFDTPETLTGLSPRGYQYPTTTTGKFALHQLGLLIVCRT